MPFSSPSMSETTSTPVTTRWRRSRLRAPAVAALAALAAVPFGSLGALQSRIVSGSIVNRVSQGRFLCNHKDDAGYVSYRVAALQRRPPSRPFVYLVGGSAVRECTVSPAGLSAAIEKRCGLHVGVFVLASSEQRFSASLAVIDRLPAAAGGIVVIGLHHSAFASGIDSATRQLHGDELLIRSPLLRAFIERRTGTEQSASLADGLRLFLARYHRKRDVEAFRGPWLSYLLHRYKQSDYWTDAFKRTRAPLWLIGRGRPNGPFFKNFGLNEALLEEAVTAARAKGFEVLLMEDSQNAGMVGDLFDPYKEMYRAVCDRLVAEQGAHYVNINRSAGLVNRDFYDLIHLLPSGRVKWQPRLANSLAEIFVDHPPATPAPSLSPSSPANGVAARTGRGLGGLLGGTFVRRTGAAR
jgi:hypothetical protein